MDDYQRNDIKVEWVTLVVAAGVAVVGYWNYRQQMSQSQEQVRQFEERFKADQQIQQAQREKEYRLRFYERQAEVYFELCDLVSRIATSRQRNAADVQKFDQLLVGKLGIVGDEDVISAVTMFNLRLRGKPIPMRVPEPPSTPTLAELAYAVSDACRSSLQKAFPGVEIGKLATYGGLGPVGPDADK